MKKKQPLTPYLIIIVSIIFFMSFPKKPTETIRGATVALLAPAWEQIHSFKGLANIFSWRTSSSEEDSKSGLTNLELEIENQMLKAEIYKLQELFEHELFLISRLTQQSHMLSPEMSNHLSQHQNDLQDLFDLQLQSIPAKVLFRSPSSWSSSLWIDVGESQNKTGEKPIITKNSPVIVGGAVVGVIDYVGKNQSRVKLITDSGLTPSVRTARGTPQNYFLMEQLQILSGNIAVRNDLFKSSKEKKQFLNQLDELKKTLEHEESSLLLAKGEIQGRSHPLWRSQGQNLKGIGFNYDFSDEEGPARDLRTGKPLNAPEGMASIPLIKENDLLVTTGLDGVFPPGLRVAQVTHVHLLREGDYYYELEAKPCAGNLDELSLVFVLPPLGYDPHDQPPFLGR